MPKRSPSSKSKSSQKKTRKTAGPSEKKGKGGGTRAPSGYLMFCAEQRVRNKTEFEQLAPKEVMKHLGAEWRKLSPSQQASYKPKAPVADKVDSSASRSQSNKKAEHPDLQPSATKKKTEQSASRKATRAHEEHHEQSDASSVE